MAVRMLASGCSYTDYCWSTWANILGQQFDSYQQVGTGGADNATVARSIVEHARSGDTVIVMWTSFDRWSTYQEKVYPMPKDANNHWRHVGSLACWDKEFFTKYYNPVERFQTTMDYVQLVDLHSKSVGYTAYHFSAFPFLSGETGIPIDTRLQEIYQHYQIDNNYLLEISLGEFRIENYNFTTNHTYTKHDTHPTPLCHWDYTEKIIAPKLNIMLNNVFKSDIISEQKNILQNGITIR
jgi:hypothetical protein